MGSCRLSSSLSPVLGSGIGDAVVKVLANMAPRPHTVVSFIACYGGWREPVDQPADRRGVVVQWSLRLMYARTKAQWLSSNVRRVDSRLKLL